jgi:hypothetical protein
MRLALVSHCHHLIRRPFALFGFDPIVIMALTGFIRPSRRGWSRRDELG